MPKWLRRTAGILTLGGGAVGFSQGAVNSFIAAMFLALCTAGIVVGVWVLEVDGRGIKWAVPYWVLQVPLFSSSFVSYQFFSGASIYTTLSSDPYIEFNTLLGFRFNFLLFSETPLLFSETPLVVGVNLVALTMSLLFWKHRGDL